MSDKTKKATGGKLLMRSGGFALSLPIVIGLGGILMLVNSLIALIIIGGLLTGDPIVAPYLGALLTILVLGVFTMTVLFRGVFRYTGGIGKLWHRMQGIQEEKERVDRLIDEHKSNNQSDIETPYSFEDNTKQQKQ